jgi:glycerol-3-phosphate acyltransferase PlsY
LNTLYWTAFGFVCGSLMFSVWLGRLALRRDIREVGDGNPGAGNVWRAGGGWRLGVPAALLDYSKGVVPVALACRYGGITGWGLMPVGLAPLLGHVFSPFLGFRGGKGIATTFGIWTGLTDLGGPLAFGLTSLVLWRAKITDGWTVLGGMIGLLAYLWLRAPEAPLLAVWAVNAALVAWRHGRELHEPLRYRYGHPDAG